MRTVRLMMTVSMNSQTGFKTFPPRRLDSDYGKRGNISDAKFKRMVNPGTFKEVQRSIFWEVTAEECGVTGTVENIS